MIGMENGQRGFLFDLLGTASPSGHERAASQAWLAWGETSADATETDALGNAYLHLRPGAESRVLLEAHIDELALLVTHIDERGFLSVDTMGRWDPEILAGQRVHVMTKGGPIRGVIGRNDLFRRSDEERNRPSRITDFWVDVGAASKEAIRHAVRVGDPVVIDVEPFSLGDGLIAGRGLDDRIGCYVIGEAFQRIAGETDGLAVTAAATVQEEIGLRGAQVCAARIRPTVAICVDLYSTSDTPTSAATGRHLGEITLGGGPVLGRGPNLSCDLLEHLAATAERYGIAVQLEAEPRPTSTDANVIQVSGSGVHTALVSIPNRYSHTPVEIVHERDVEEAIRLISLAVADLPSTGLL